MLNKLKEELKGLSNLSKAKILSSFFKTGKGEYGEGDIFIGITVPDARKIALKYMNLSLVEVQELIKSKIHEERLIGLLILVAKYDFYLKNYNKHNSIKFDYYPKDIFNFYLENLNFINNWDLVDLSAHKIVGQYLYHVGKEYPLYKILLTNLAKSSNLWERRIAIISTFYFIKNNEFSEPLKISEMLLQDKHDLIHKAVGWMLREVGKKNISVLENFLKKHYKVMPRTMLRYAIEKMPESKRLSYLKGKV